MGEDAVALPAVHPASTGGRQLVLTADEEVAGGRVAGALVAAAAARGVAGGGLWGGKGVSTATGNYNTVYVQRFIY